MTNPELGQGRYKMSLEHVVKLESKGRFKNHIEGMSQDRGTSLEGLPVAKLGSV